MPSSTVCWGIEVGAYAVKALKLEADGESVKVLDFAVIPHKKPLSTPGTDPNDTVRITLGELVSQYDIGGGSATIAMSVPGHSAFARFAKLPPVDPKKVPDIVKFEAVQQIPFPLEQVEWDYQTFRSDDSPDIEVGIFAITRERIMERLTLYEDVDIVPDCVTLSPVAAFNALAYDMAFTEKTPGTIILDIGTTSTDLVIAEAGRVWIRTFPIGGHHFTEALVNAFQLSYPKAEKLKKEAESSKHARHIFQAMRPIFGDLAQDVQRSIGYYQTLHKDAKLERLIGLGSTFRLPGLRKYLKQQVGLDVFRLEQFKRLSIDGPRAGELQASTLNMATAYGLALQGLEMSTLEANLMPTLVVREAMWKRKAKWFGVAAGVAVAAALTMQVRPFLDSQAVASEPPPPLIRETIQEAQRYKSAAGELTSSAIENAAAASVLGLLQSREVFAHIVSDVGQMLSAARAPGAAEAGPVFAVKSLRTRIGSGQQDPQPGGWGMEPQGDARERISITLTVVTDLPDPQRLVYSTFDEWLRRNAKRPGVPYEIVIEGRPSRFVSATEGGGAIASAPGASGPVWSGTPGGDGAVQPGAGGRMRGGPQPGGDAGEVGRHPPGVTFIGPGGQTAGPGGAGTPDLEAGQAQTRVQQLAPLEHVPQYEPTARVSTFVVTWDAVLLPRQGEEGGGI